VHRALLVLALLVSLSACSSLQRMPRQDFFVLFFVPDTIELAPEAQQIVRQAAANAKDGGFSKIDIAVPGDAPGNADLVEGRFTAIQNILSASGIDPKLFEHARLSDTATNLPGAANRAEIKLLR